MKNKVNFSFLKEKRAQQTWLVLVIAWACIRAVVINDVFGSYGINGWAYFVVDLGTAIPYAIYSGRSIINYLNKDWISIRKNTVLAFIFFYIPDLYVLIYAKKPPTSLLIGFLVSICFFTFFAIWGLHKDVSKKKECKERLIP